MNKNEIDDAAIALRKEKYRARQAAYRAANREKLKAVQACLLYTSDAADE